MKSVKWISRVTMALGVLALLAGLAAFVLVSLWIGTDVRAIATTATQHHQGDHVEALMQFVEDTSHSVRDRNRAVWALGQLGDQRALPVLRKHYSGRPCDHATMLCQHELDKAIKLLDGCVNATALVWRR